MHPPVATLDLVAKSTPQFTIVGIVSKCGGLNVTERKGAKDDFTRFLEKELFPLIEREYPASGYRVLSGHSHAGKYVMNQWISGTLPVSQFFAFSPSLDDGYLREKVNKTDTKETQDTRATCLDDGQ